MSRKVGFSTASIKLAGGKVRTMFVVVPNGCDYEYSGGSVWVDESKGACTLALTTRAIDLLRWELVDAWGKLVKQSETEGYHDCLKDVFGDAPVIIGRGGRTVRL